MFLERRAGESTYFVFPELEKIPGLIHAFTSRQTDLTDKDAGLSGEVAPGKAALLKNLGLEPCQLVLLQQQHSDRVVVRQETPSERDRESVYGADGVILPVPGCFSVIRTADCLPIIGVLEEQKWICAFRAGWRGTRDEITRKGLRKFLEVSGASAEELIVALGPCIRRCCYEVGPEVIEQYASKGYPISRLSWGCHLDLVAANRIQLEEEGVRTILDSEMCTACRTDLFYSYRREGQTGRQWSLAGFVV